jgi:hypothetical protein
MDDPRYVAGGPIQANIYKCQLKPIDAADYKVTFTPPSWHASTRSFRVACVTGPSRG